jgi:hypothetical protein
LCANLREKGGRVAASRFDWILSAYLEGTPQTTEKLSFPSQMRDWNHYLQDLWNVPKWLPVLFGRGVFFHF